MFYLGTNCVHLPKWFTLAILTLAAGVWPLFGQAGGQIQGTIVDPSGASIAGAHVRLTDTQKGVVVQENVTQADGSFTFQPLPAGQYAIHAESPGMKALDRTGITLDVNRILNLGQVKMTLGSENQQVTVEAASPLVETTTAQKDFTIDSKQVLETSTDGRDFQSLLITQPGVVTNNTSDFRLAFNSTNQFNVNGLRNTANVTYLDGSINTDVGANDGEYTQLSLDAIGEFKVQTSTFNAEYGRIAGVLIAANTKSGGQSFHGTAYEFDRNDAFDSNSFFNNLQGLGKSKLRFNQFGGNLSGPINFIPKVSTPHNKKLFFFFNYEGTRASRPQGNSYYDVPNPAEFSGNFASSLRYNTNGTPQLVNNCGGSASCLTYQVGTVFQPGTVKYNNAGLIIAGTPYAGNRIPTSQFSSQAAAFIKLLSPAYRGLTSFTQTPGTPSEVRIPFQDTYNFDKDQKALRVDYAISSKMNAFFRWVDDAQQESQGDGIFSTNAFPVLPQYRGKPGSSWSWNVINTLSPTTTNEFIFTYNHLNQIVDVSGANPSSYDASALGFNFQNLYQGVNLRNTFPTFNAPLESGAAGYNIQVFDPGWHSGAKTFTGTDNFTKILNSHTLKAGVFIDVNTAGQQPTWNGPVNFDFSPSQLNTNDSGIGMANLLLGNYTSAQQSNGVFFGHFKFYQDEAYLQDSWKASRNLTLEYGVRWQYLGPTFTYGNVLQNYWEQSLYNPAQAVSINTTSGPAYNSIITGSGNPYNGIVKEGTKGFPQGGADHRFNNWSPRLGIAWDPFGDGKTAIRAGGGVFYERIRQNQNSFGGLSNPPLSYTPTVYNGNIANLNPSLITGSALFPVGLTSFNQQGKIPTIYSWSVDVQHQFSNSLALDIGYVGNIANHLQVLSDSNQLPLGTTTNTNILQTVNNASNALRPYAGYTTNAYTDFAANSNYNALQVQLTRRFTSNVTISANYTWSKAMDQVDDDTTPIPDAFNRREEYGPAGFNRTNVFTINYVYLLPKFTRYNQFVKQTLGGWEVTGITRFWSGFPISILSYGTNPGNLDGGNYGNATYGTTPYGGVRADYIGGQITPANKTWQEYFNPLAFGAAANGTLGNTGRNFLTGPGVNQWDVSLFKNFNMTESMRLQLRLETFNTFNHTQFSGVNTEISAAAPGLPVTSATIGTAGQVNSTRDPRTVQIGAKFYF